MGSRLAPVIAVLFFAFLTLTTLSGKLPVALLGLYAGASIAAFVAYAADKSAARNQRWRIRENTLHLLALIGGWPGALVAQNCLRHKSGKRSFLAVFWVSTLLNCIALALFMTWSGAGAPHGLAGIR